MTRARKLERPPALEEGEYWIGRFHVTVKGDQMSVSSRQNWSHSHQRVDKIRLDSLSTYNCMVGIEKQKDSAEAEKRIQAIFTDPEWKPRKPRYK